MKLICNIGLALLILTSSLASNANSFIQSSSLSSTGKLSGLVLDRGEARVVGAKIIIERKDFRREVISSLDDGSYEVALPEGKYKVSVMAVGFHLFRRECVIIKSNATTKFNITLKEIIINEQLFPVEELRIERGIINEIPPEKKPVTKP